MAMTYSDAKASIEDNSWFKNRVRISASFYSNYLLNTDPGDAEYAAKVNAGMNISRQADMVVNTLMFTLSGDAEVLAAGPAIADAALQPIVEKTINKFWPVTPAAATASAFYPAPAPAPPPRPQ